MSQFNLSKTIEKGGRFNLSKSDSGAPSGLTRVRIGLGWDPNETDDGPPFDLDVSAFAIDSNFKIPSSSYFVFYNQVNMGNRVEDENEKGLYRPITIDKSILGAIDDPDGKRSDGDDDEDMIIHLDKITDAVQQIIIVVTICKYPDHPDKRTANLNFGMVDDCYIRILNDKNGEELVKYTLKEDFSKEDAVQFGRLYRVGGQWEFEAMGTGNEGGLASLVDIYT
jgi:tellurium resistance protein TerD